jgi:hypothetical protein
LLEVKEKSGEKNVSTKKYCQETSPRIQSTDEDERWPFSPEKKTCKRTKASDGVGMVFFCLRTPGRRFIP